MNFTITVYMTVEAAKKKDAQAFADELKKHISMMRESKHGYLFPEAVNIEVEKEDD